MLANRTPHPLRFKTFHSASHLLDAAAKEYFTLYLLDVMMPGINGLTVAREIRSFDDSAAIVFLSSSPDFAYESYSVRALDYLLKPIDPERFFPFWTGCCVRSKKHRRACC